MGEGNKYFLFWAGAECIIANNAKMEVPGHHELGRMLRLNTVWAFAHDDRRNELCRQDGASTQKRGVAAEREVCNPSRLIG